MFLQSDLQTSSRQRATVCIEYNAKFHFGGYENIFHFKDPINEASLTRTCEHVRIENRMLIEISKKLF